MAVESDAPPPEERSFAALLSDLFGEAGLLLRQEVRLFRAELSEQFGRAGSGAVLLAAGAVVALSGWGVLLAAAVLGLAHVVPAWLAALIVGGVVLALGAMLLWLGRRRVAVANFVPHRTLASLREDEAWIREQFR
jgi:Putative Actinobacterial Holin-X, holin superfamily III